ncbi:MAG: formyltetrahydrofolate deformylase [Anaerolineales bacterium]|nr:formyltetrahydrofolate deformylase [Anaerolineales bacterium]
MPDYPQIILIECPDRKGLIHAVTDVLLRHGVNIVQNNEFVDHNSGRFYMRTAAEHTIEQSRVAGELQAVLPPGASVRFPTCEKRRIVIFATKEYHCLGDLLLRHAFGDLNAEIRAVISNHAELGDLVRRFDVPYHHIRHEGKTRAQHEAEILAELARYDPEYIILAKYMRVLTADFINRFPSRMINIHHSFLPAFTGASPYRQAYERGVKIIGATAHFVTEKLDEGPIIAQGILPVAHTYTVEDMIRAGRDVEKSVLARAVKLVLDERVFLCGQRTIIFE